MSFLEAEKARYERDKQTATWLDDSARGGGLYRGHLRPFCIPEECADQNLFAGTRERVLAYFRTNKVKWHDETPAGPSNHLCSSMVCGVNFLSPMMQNESAATVFLQGLFGDEVAVAVRVSDEYVEFEWVGNPAIDYLGEGLNRTRGANATSADAAMAYMRTGGGKTLVLIEWKYTESYSTDYKGAGSQGDTRRKRYEKLFNRPDSPIDVSRVAFDETLYEPFYQFMRQQLLAWRMASGGEETGADSVRVLHISPGANHDFERVTSPELARRHPEAKSTALWRSLLRAPETFLPASVEEAFAAPIESDEDLGLRDWRAYVSERYPWALRSR